MNSIKRIKDNRNNVVDNLKSIFKKHTSSTVAIILSFVLLMTIGFGTTVQAKETDEYLKEVETLKDLIMQSYSGGDVTEDALFEAAMEGMTSILDDYSIFYNKVDAQVFFDAISSEYVGIGVRLEVINELIVVTEVFEGGAAHDANVQVNDIINRVNGELAADYELNELVDKIVGEEGTFVTVEFKRGGIFYELELERRKISIPTVVSLELDGETYNISEELSSKIASYKITSFADATDESFSIEIQKAIENKVEYLVIDMRDNGGGYLDTAVNMLKELIPAGTIVSLVDKSGVTDIKKSTLEKAPFKVVLIVNTKSASASEIFAGAIKDSNVGVVIGEQTYGKGVAQNIYRLGAEYLVKLTTQEFFSPNGNKINGVGVTPDIIVDTPEYIFSDRRFYSSDVDEQIVNVEGMLKILGYFNGVPDDTYTYETYLAVYAFQSATGLYPYGVCDFTTQARLNTEYRIVAQKNDVQMKEAVKWIVKDTQN